MNPTNDSFLLGHPLRTADLLLFTRIEIQHGIDILADLVAFGFSGRVSRIHRRLRRKNSFCCHLDIPEACVASFLHAVEAREKSRHPAARLTPKIRWVTRLTQSRATANQGNSNVSPYKLTT